MNKTIFGTGIIFGVSAIILGAFAAHALKEMIDIEALASFETGVKYQMYHALFLLFLGTIKEVSAKNKQWIYYLVTLGVICFSFSIYFLATNALTTYNFKTLGLLTPFGGMLLILGWLLLGYRVFKRFN